jgi:hypothetical protein
MVSEPWKDLGRSYVDLQLALSNVEVPALEDQAACSTSIPNHQKMKTG